METENQGLVGQDGHRINLSCLVDALSKFKTPPKCVGDVFYLMVETMAHRIQQSGKVILLDAQKQVITPYLSIKMVAVAYALPDGTKALTWEVM